MIYCVLDGDRVYPSLSQNIKITSENPELKDKENVKTKRRKRNWWI